MSFEIEPILPGDAPMGEVRNSIAKSGFGLHLLNLSLRMTSNPGFAIETLSQVINKFGKPESIATVNKMDAVMMVYQAAKKSSKGISYIRREILKDDGRSYGSVPFVELVNENAGKMSDPEHVFSTLDYVTKENVSKFPINIVLMLRLIQGLNAAQTAYLLGTSSGNVGVLLSRGMYDFTEAL